MGTPRISCSDVGWVGRASPNISTRGARLQPCWTSQTRLVHISTKRREVPGQLRLYKLVQFYLKAVTHIVLRLAVTCSRPCSSNCSQATAQHPWAGPGQLWLQRVALLPPTILTTSDVLAYAFVVRMQNLALQLKKQSQGDLDNNLSKTT